MSADTGAGLYQNKAGNPLTTLDESENVPCTQHVGLKAALGCMETSSINLEKVEIDPHKVQETNFAVKLLKKIEKNETLVAPPSSGSVKFGAVDLSLGGTRGGKEEGSIVNSNSVGPSTQIFETDGTDSTVVNNPKKRSWKRLPRNTAEGLPTEEVKLGKRAIILEAEEDGQNRKQVIV
ncbi:hypothetical protein ACOSQ3_018407 [Xanthoceras sorbifolium]